MKTLRIMFMVMAILCITCSSILCADKSLREQRKDFFKEFKSRGVPMDNQNYSPEDRKFFSTLLKLKISLEAACREPNEPCRAKAEETIGRLSELDGYTFSMGRVFRKDSSLAAMAQLAIINVAAEKKDCKTAWSLFESLRGLVDSEYFIVKPDVEVAFDANHDREIYSRVKHYDIYDVATLLSARCFGADAADIYSSNQEENLQFDIFLDFTSAVGSSQEFPGGGYVNAKKLMKIAEDFTGHRFASGHVFRKESNIMLMSYAASILTTDSNNDCETARQDYDKFKTLAKSDYFLWDIFTLNVYDATMDPDTYALQKQKNLEWFKQIMREGFTPGSCFTTDEFNSLFQK
jgi:hypothetical protein